MRKLQHRQMDVKCCCWGNTLAWYQWVGITSKEWEMADIRVDRWKERRRTFTTSNMFMPILSVQNNKVSTDGRDIVTGVNEEWRMADIRDGRWKEPRRTFVADCWWYASHLRRLLQTSRTSQLLKHIHTCLLIHIWRCRRIERCRSRWSPYH